MENLAKDLSKIAYLRLYGYLYSSETGIKTLLDYASKATSGENFVLLTVDSSSVIEGIATAYLNAYLHYLEGGMRSRSLALEILLFLSKDMNISKAITKIGAKDSKSFFVFCNNKEIAESFLNEYCTKKKSLRINLDLEKSGRIALAGISD